MFFNKILNKVICIYLSKFYIGFLEQKGTRVSLRLAYGRNPAFKGAKSASTRSFKRAILHYKRLPKKKARLFRPGFKR